MHPVPYSCTRLLYIAAFSISESSSTRAVLREVVALNKKIFDRLDSICKRPTTLHYNTPNSTPLSCSRSSSSLFSAFEDQSLCNTPPATQNSTQYNTLPATENPTQYNTPPATQNPTQYNTPPATQNPTQYNTPPATQNPTQYNTPPATQNPTQYNTPPATQNPTQYNTPPATQNPTQYNTPPATQNPTQYNTPPQYNYDQPLSPQYNSDQPLSPQYNSDQSLSPQYNSDQSLCSTMPVAQTSTQYSSPPTDQPMYNASPATLIPTQYNSPPDQPMYNAPPATPNPTQYNSPPTDQPMYMYNAPPATRKPSQYNTTPATRNPPPTVYNAPPAKNLAQYKNNSPEADNDLVSNEDVLLRYPKLNTLCKVGSLAAKLAREAYFGKDLMTKCSVFGARGRPSLPAPQLKHMKSFLINRFKFNKAPQEFEPHWKFCIDAINHSCNFLRCKAKEKIVDLTHTESMSSNDMESVDTLANILPTQQYNIVREVINKNALDFLSQ